MSGRGVSQGRGVTTRLSGALFWVAATAALFVQALVFAAMATPLPSELERAGASGAGGGGTADFDGSTRVLDRHGVLLREVRSEHDDRAEWVRLGEVGEWVPKALLAAEDGRFYEHAGIDPLATLRAAAQAVRRGRVVSGASTLSQQLARVLDETPRTASGKVRVVVTALRIERDLDKDQILEQYLNHVSFGLGTRGIEAASRAYFDKPSRELSLAEAATLASIPRGPAVYDPVRGKVRLMARRERVLSQIEAHGWATSDEIARARGEALTLSLRRPGGLAPHFVRALVSGKLDSTLAGDDRDGEERPREITTTLDAELQREVEALAAATVSSLRDKDVTAASVVVVDNASGDLLAYVGSHDLFDERGLGHNDGLLARRQPGSTLKPFLYGLAIEKLGMTAATVLPDVDTTFPAPTGVYHPQNYDGRFHGPVRLREALASSYNVPAVWTTREVGEHALVERLNRLDLDLREGAGHYGLALALGDAEVRPLDLAAAYVALAREGVARPLRAVLGGVESGGAPVTLAPRAERRVMDARGAALIADILADERARLDGFGPNSVLDLPFRVSVKTGTSKGFRDNLTVGFSERVTTLVWVGNFDGSPMRGTSGVTGAGPLFRDVMLAVHRRLAHDPELGSATADEGLASRDGFVTATICPLSGKRPGPSCPHRVSEVFIGHPPHAICDMHEEVAIHRETGLLAGPACPDAAVERRTVEVFPAVFVAWASEARRPIAPRESFPGCPAEPSPLAPERPRVAYPPDGARFVLDPEAAAPGAIILAAHVPQHARHVVFLVNGTRLPAQPGGKLEWPLRPGTHELRVLGDEVASAAVRFSVE